MKRRLAVASSRSSSIGKTSLRLLALCSVAVAVVEGWISTTTTTTTTTAIRSAGRRQQPPPPPWSLVSPPRDGTCFRGPTRLGLYAPPGSGYQRLEDEVAFLPDTYEPMMEYPGTMRPGRTPENMPFQDLPIGDADPDPVPWPHFQQIDWHFRWDPPHPHPTPMEQFIEDQGRWATPEMEAAMRAGIRRGVRERKEKEEADRRGTVITDDDEDDEMVVDEAPVSLGDGIFGQLGSTADQAATVAAVDPARQTDDNNDDETTDEEDDESALDDFLLDLGLDTGLNDEANDEEEKSKKKVTKSLRDLDADEDDDEEEGVQATPKDMTATIHVEEDVDDLGFEEEDEDMGDGSDTVPLDDFGDDQDDGMDENIFDEGGFDFGDDYGGGDGGDMW